MMQVRHSSAAGPLVMVRLRRVSTSIHGYPLTAQRSMVPVHSGTPPICRVDIGNPARCDTRSEAAALPVQISAPRTDNDSLLSANERQYAINSNSALTR